MVQSFLQGALIVRKVGATTPESHRPAYVVLSVQTVFALVTRHTDFESDAITDSQIMLGSNIDPQRRDHASSLMTLRDWLPDPNIAIAIMGVVVYVCTAQCSSLHFNLYFVDPWRGKRSDDLREYDQSSSRIALLDLEAYQLDIFWSIKHLCLVVCYTRQSHVYLTIF